MGNKTEENEVARDGVPESSMNPASVSSERNSSDETDETIIKLQPVICNGSVLKLPVGQDDSQTYSVVSKIIKHIYATRLPSIQCVLPEGYDKWDDSDPVNAKKLINAYNPAAKKHFKLWNGAVNKDLDDWALPYCTETVAAQICNLAIECTIPDPKILNSHYKSFSPEVYGETNLEQMALIIKQLNLDQNDVFVDMGSGIGQLVAFTAAFSKVKKAIGIEIADRPSMYASKLQDTFEKLMSHFGKQHASFKLYKGSFLDQKFIDMILKEATVLFINNVAFGPELNTEIKAKIISELNNGVRIVSTREFASMKREINERQLNAGDGERMSKTSNATDVTALLDVKVLESCHQPCSWTSKKVPFYLHTVDGTKIVEFFNQKMNGKRMSATPSREGSQSKDCKEPKSRKKESSESRRSSTSTPPVVKNETRFDDDDENWCGRTTRLMWKAQTEKCAQKQKTPAPSSPKRPADDNDYAPLKKSRKTTEKKRKNSASVKATTSSAAAAATAATSTASIAAAAATTPTTTTAKTVTTTVTSPQQSQKQQPAAPEQLKQASKMLSSPTAPEAAVKVEQKPDSSVMEYIHQLHDKTVISTQQMHSAKEEIARGELVRIMLPLQNEQMDAATQQQQQNHQPPLPPPPPSQQPIVQHIVPPQVIPANNNHMDLATDQRHTFMIPPTDPLYNSIVSFYLSLKSLINKAQSGDAEFVQALRQEIEVEKIRNRELKDIVNNVSNSVKAELARGVGFMHERLVDLDMGNVQEVSELLIGSKNIVSRHKELTQRVAHEQATVAQYEQMIRDKNGNIGERLLEQDFSFEMMDELQNQNKTNPDEQTDQNLLSPTVNSSTSATNYANISNSSSGSQSRRNRPRQRAGANAKRIGSGAEKVEEPSEEVELSIQRFVKEALKVDNAVKEKERRARGSGGAGHSDKISSRKGSMDDKIAVKQRTRIKQNGNGLGGATNTPNSHHSSESPLGIRRKRAGEIRREETPRPSKAKKEMPKGQDLVDRIWIEIDNQQKEQKEKRALRKAAEEALKGKERTSPVCFSLTAANLKMQQQDDTIAKEFIQRETIVDQLLGYKMLLGKMENYTTLGFVKVELPVADDSPEAKAQRDGVYEAAKNSKKKKPMTPPLPPPPLPIIDQMDGGRPKKGPKTPPGSPGPSTPPPEPYSDTRQNIVAQLAQMVNTTAGQVEMYMGKELNDAFNSSLNKNEILNTLKSALQALSSNKTPESGVVKSKQNGVVQSEQMDMASASNSSVDFDGKQILTAPPPPPQLMPPPPPPINSLQPVAPPPPPPAISLPSMSFPPPPPPQLPTAGNYQYTTNVPPPPINVHQPPPVMVIPNKPPPPLPAPPAPPAIAPPIPPPIAPPPVPTGPTMPMMNVPPPVIPQRVVEPPKVEVATPASTGKKLVELKSIVEIDSSNGAELTPQFSRGAPKNWTPITTPKTQPDPMKRVQNTLFSALGFAGEKVQSAPVANSETPTRPTPQYQGQKRNTPNRGSYQPFYKNFQQRGSAGRPYNKKK